MSDVTIIIPTIRANEQLLADCVEACADTAPDAELIVADYGGTFAENCNEGARRASGDVFVFLNDDTIPQPHWLDRMVACFADQIPSVGVVGARLLYPDGRIQHTGVFFTTDANGLVAMNRTWDEPSGPVDAVTGACMAIRRELWDELGGFDPLFRNGYDDIDLCLRTLTMGWGIWYCADATIFHHESASGPARWSHVAENVQLLQERWVVSDPPAV